MVGKDYRNCQMKGCAKMNRRQTHKDLLGRGFNWLDWNEDGTELTASMTAGGVTIRCIRYTFTKSGRLVSEMEVK